MQFADLRSLYGFDRWATRRVLAVLDGVGEAVWSTQNVIGDRGPGGILVHHLGAHQRWRHGLSDSSEGPRPEREPLPTPAGLAAAWETEWMAFDAWLDSLDDAAVNATDEGIPYWQMPAHVVNHGTQHRAEAAAVLTSAGCSPGDLDMIFYSEGLASARGAEGEGGS
ncbi:MAG: DinB family protein [Candidatus Limnocylindrales bacterium]